MRPYLAYTAPWNGTVTQYNDVPATAAAAIRAGNPRAQVLMAGLVFPDYDWRMPICDTHANEGSFDIAPFHAYPEIWGTSTVETYLDTHYYNTMCRRSRRSAAGNRFWLSEMSYAATPGRPNTSSRIGGRAFATYRSDAHEKQGSPVVSLTLSKLGSTAISYGLGGTATSYPNFDGATLTGVRLAPHEISIFEIMP